jgi:hypothetical protein
MHSGVQRKSRKNVAQVAPREVLGEHLEEVQMKDQEEVPLNCKEKMQNSSGFPKGFTTSTACFLPLFFLVGLGSCSNGGAQQPRNLGDLRPALPAAPSSAEAVQAGKLYCSSLKGATAGAMSAFYLVESRDPLFHSLKVTQFPLEGGRPNFEVGIDRSSITSNGKPKFVWKGAFEANNLPENILEIELLPEKKSIYVNHRLKDKGTILCERFPDMAKDLQVDPNAGQPDPKPKVVEVLNKSDSNSTHEHTGDDDGLNDISALCQKTQGVDCPTTKVDVTPPGALPPPVQMSTTRTGPNSTAIESTTIGTTPKDKK